MVIKLISKERNIWENVKRTMEKKGERHFQIFPVILPILVYHYTILDKYLTIIFHISQLENVSYQNLFL
ncbi:MAG: hypothetical protein DRQ13_05920 [Ignavibacteriae bacterium]|nr:MAG: hypothetical protein DRQ13_05920 [Ignavibacteriota bacterium]